MEYNLSYVNDSIRLEITSLTQPLIDYLLKNNSLVIPGRNNYTLNFYRGGTNILDSFDNGQIKIWIAEDATPESFQPLRAMIDGYTITDFDELNLRVISVFSQLDTILA